MIRFQVICFSPIRRLRNLPIVLFNYLGLYIDLKVIRKSTRKLQVDAK